MKKIITCVLVLLFLTMVFVTPVSAEIDKKEWSKLKKDYKSSLKKLGTGDISSALTALLALKTVDGKEPVELVMKNYAKVWAKINGVPIAEQSPAGQKYLNTYVDVLASYSSQEALDALIVKGVNGKDWQAQVLAIEVFGSTSNKLCLPALNKLIVKKKLKSIVLGRSLETLAKFKDLSSLDALLTVAGQEKRWQVLLGVIDVAKAINDMRSVPVLIKCLDYDSIRVKAYANEVLVEMTGFNFKESVKNWTSWYDKNKARIEAQTMEHGTSGKTEAGKGSAVYYGMRITSDKIVFIFDVSRSMLGSADGSTPPGGSAPSGVKNLLDAVKEELTKAIESLPDGITFNLISYSTAVTLWQPSMTKVGKKSKASAIKFLKDSEPGGYTFTAGAIERALLLAQGLTEANSKAVTSGNHKSLVADTIYLLSDGKPNNGKDPNSTAAETLVAVAKMNRDMRIQINTIFVGRDVPVAIDFMKKLAAQEGGQYKRVK